MAELKAGVARQIISPARGIYQIGYGDRHWGNKGIHDDLTATALALDDGGNRVVIIACDLLAINEETVSRVQAEVGERIIICCSHTHSGPITYANERASRRKKAYVSFLVERLVQVTRKAEAALEPASLLWGQSRADISENRRERKPDGSVVMGVNPQGSVDRTIEILQVQAAGGKIMASVVNYPCHNTVMGPSNLLISADWAGAMRRNIEAETGALCLYLQGATADINPKYGWGDRDIQAVELLGGIVAESIIRVLDELTPLEIGPIQFSTSQIWLPLEALADTPEPPPTYRLILAKLAHVPKLLVDLVLNARYPWRTEIQARQGRWAVPMALSITRVGELVLVAMGAEVFNEIGIGIKELSPFAHTLVSTVSNGCIGYLPTAKEHALGGYEVDLAPYFYRLPGRICVNAADLVTERIRSELNRLFEDQQGSKSMEQVVNN
jgi:hypothetical protein